MLTNPEPTTNTQHLIGPDSRGPTHALPKDPIYENVTYATESPTLLLQFEAIAASIFLRGRSLVTPDLLLRSQWRLLWH